MKLINPENHFLECVNCGAVYYDTWPSRVTPLCPVCHCSHYADAEGSVHGPTKRGYQVYATRIGDVVQEDSSEYWRRYNEVRQVLDKEVGMNEVVVHQRALRHAKRITGLNGRLEVCQAAEETNRKQKHEFNKLGYREVENLPDGQNVEAIVVTHETLEELAHVWDNGQTHGLSFAEAISLEYPGAAASLEEKRYYWCIQQRLKRILRQHVKKYA